jgi:hypothetical protein
MQLRKPFLGVRNYFDSAATGVVFILLPCVSSLAWPDLSSPSLCMLATWPALAWLFPLFAWPPFPCMVPGLVLPPCVASRPSPAPQLPTLVGFSVVVGVSLGMLFSIGCFVLFALYKNY